MWELNRKEAERWRIDAFELWCWRRLLRVSWTTRRSNQSILKEINPEYLWEELMLKLKLQYFGHLMQRANSLWPHESQYTRPPCPSPTPRVHSDSCPSSQWCHPSSHLICRSLLLLLPILPSIRVLSNESALCMRWPKYWSFSFSIIPSKEHPEFSFRMDWLDLLVVQETLKSLLQHHSSKASMLRSSAFFTVQLSHPYMTTGKTIALTRWTLVGKVMSLLLNMKRQILGSYKKMKYQPGHRSKS